MFDEDLVIRDEGESCLEELEQKIGFSGAGGAENQNGVGPIRAWPGGARGVQAHDGGNVASFLRL
jgi:hypothetical protein